MARVQLPGADVAVRGPLGLTTVPRTLIDCAREWDLEDAVVAMDAALLREWTTLARLADAASAAGQWPGPAAPCGPSTSPTDEPSHRWRPAAASASSVPAFRHRSCKSRSGRAGA